jgi:iron complex transport system permease protein
MSIRKRLALTVAICLGVLALSLLLCTVEGSADIPPKTVLSIVLKPLGFDIAGGASRTQEIIIRDIRLPRVLLASIVGGGLAIAGCVMQALFKNPMAEPGVLGWASGGALAAVILIYTGVSEKNILFLPVGAFLGSLAAAIIVYKVADVGGESPTSMLLLAGVAMSSLFTALITLVLSVASVWTMKEMLFWLLGGVDARGWVHIPIAGVPTLAASFGITLFAKDLNAMMMGEETASTLGVNVGRVRGLLLLLCSLIVGAAVSVSGVIGFVGLIVPHLMRLIVGANHRVLLPGSFLAGASFLPLADLLTRTLAKPVELRLGITTACLGVPFFLYLLRKNKTRLTGMV